ncbi:MAG: response regulator [Patescibacteria group bacterium]|nr:response regulator [Patescibacteria group bacterium]
MTDTRVVVIDDDRDTVGVFCEYLSIHDFDIVARGFDGRTAVELYKEHKPDVILIDLHMPDPDNKYFEGLDALKAIRKFDQQSKIIIVIGDELFSVEEEKELVRLKVNAVIFKPYEIDSIVQSIENVLKSETYTSIFDINAEVKRRDRN